MAKKLEQRFWDKVQKGANDDCWEWTGTTSCGYGRISDGGTMKKAHRVSWEMHYGSIPEGTGYHGTCVLHKCDNRRCVRPDHLFLGSNSDNVTDRVNKDRSAKPTGSLNGRVKLNEFQTQIIHHLLKSRVLTQEQIGEIFNVSQVTISHIKLGKRWNHEQAII